MKNVDVTVLAWYDDNACEYRYIQEPARTWAKIALPDGFRINPGAKAKLVWCDTPRFLTMDEARAESAWRGWLMVDEFVPGFEGEVWVIVCGKVYAGKYMGDKWRYYRDEHIMWASQFGYEVTHWRPIVKPEPPEGCDK